MTEAETRAWLSQGLEKPLQELRRLNGWLRAAEFLVFSSLWGLGFQLTTFEDVRLKALGVLLLSVGLNAGVLLVHEGMHGLLGPPRVNLWLSRFLAGCMFCSFTAYRNMHTRHHQHLGGAGDPDDYYNYTRSTRLVFLLQYVRLLTGTFLYLVLMPLLAWPRLNRAERQGMLLEYALMSSLYVPLFCSVPLERLVEVWLAPILVVGLFTNLRGLVQHGLGDRHAPLLASRSIHPHPLVAFLLLNENLHLEHHLFPEIPSYNLPRLHQLLKPKLGGSLVSHSYMEVLWGFLKATPRLDETPVGSKL